MPFDLNKIKAREVEIALSFDDETLEFFYRPNKLTFEMAEKLDGSGTAANLQALTELISRWNITNDKGKLLPIDEEHLKSLPTQLLGKMTQAIVEDMFPNAPTTETPGSF